MKEIRLTRGCVALVDDEDYARLSRFNWFARFSSRSRTFYAARNTGGEENIFDIKRRTVFMHHVVIGWEREPDTEVDHKNGNGLDNRKENLRIVSMNQNQWNATLRTDNKTGMKGVSLHAGSAFIARIRKGGRETHIGSYATIDEAGHAYNKAAVRLHGEFARLNPVGTDPRSEA